MQCPSFRGKYGKSSSSRNPQRFPAPSWNRMGTRTCSRSRGFPKKNHPPWVGSLNPVEGSEFRQKPVEVGSSLSGVHQLRLLGFLEIQRPVDLCRKNQAARAFWWKPIFRSGERYHLWRIVSENAATLRFTHLI